MRDVRGRVFAVNVCSITCLTSSCRDAAFRLKRKRRMTGVLRILRAYILPEKHFLQ